jgi:uncharacterized protein YjdB
MSRRPFLIIASVLIALSCGDGPTAVRVTETADSRGGGGGTTCPGVPGKTTNVFVVPNAVTMASGDSVNLDATNQAGVPIADCNLKWTSNAPTVAIVSATGRVTALKDGIARISATTVIAKRTLTGVSEVTVRTPVSSLSIDPTAATLAVGAAQQFVATTKDGNGNILTGRPISWMTADSTVARVSESGLVTASAYAGAATRTVTISATSEGKDAVATLTVTPAPVVSVTVTPATATLAMGSTQQLSAETRDASGGILTERTITWASSDESILQVSPTGMVTVQPYTGNASRTVTVTASSEGRIGLAVLTVLPAPVAQVVIAPNAATLTVGESQLLEATLSDVAGATLTGRSVSWSSSDSTVVSVTASGLAVARPYNGNAIRTVSITAVSEGKTATATITVTPSPVATVVVNPSSATVVSGATVTLTAQTRDAAGGVLPDRAISWASSNPSVASVSATGEVAASAYVGPLTRTATIVATSEGKSAEAIISVGPIPAASLVITPATARITVGTILEISAGIFDASGAALTGRTVAWTSSDTAVVTISAAGVATARPYAGPAERNATITASLDGQTASATITVLPVAVAAVAVSPDTSTLSAGAMQQFVATLTDAAGTVLTGRVITWTLSDSIATVSAEGLVTIQNYTGADARAFSITATSEGRSGSALVVVTPTPVASLQVTPDSATIASGAKQLFVATALSTTGAVLNGRTVVWSTSDSSVATIMPTGEAAAVAYRSAETRRATLTASSEGKTRDVAITVLPSPVFNLRIQETSTTIFVGRERQLRAVALDAAGDTLIGRTYLWKSSDTTLVQVNEAGLIKAVAVGAASITVSSHNTSASVPITVVPTGTLSGKEIFRTVIVTAAEKSRAQEIAAEFSGGAGMFTAALSPTGRKPATHYISTGFADSAIFAAIEEELTAEDSSDEPPFTALARLGLRLVTEFVTVSVSPSTSVLSIGMSQQLSAVVLGDEGDTLSYPILWKTSDSTIARVTTTGLVTAIAPGTVTITADGVEGTGSASITVRELSVAYKNTNAGLIPGEPDSILVASPTPTLVAQFNFDITRPFDYTSPVLAEGKAYRIRISGRGGVGPLDGSNYQNSMSDAAFYFCGFFENLDTCQVKGDGLNWPPGWDGIGGRRPSPDVYTTTHMYDYYLRGTGRPLVWTFRDNPYSDNRGDFVVRIDLMGDIVGTGTPPAPVAAVSLNMASATLLVGGTQQVIATLTDAGGASVTGRTVTWSSSNAAVASVSTSGLITAIAPGTASIAVTSEGKSATLIVVVEVSSRLLAEYPLTAGTTTDISGNNNRLILTGGRWVADRFGVDSSAIEFDGVSGGLVTADSILSLGEPEYTISLWFLRSDYAVWSGWAEGLIGTNPHTGIGFGFDHNVPGSSSLALGDGLSFWKVLYNRGTKTDWLANAWYHAALRKSGTRYQVYIDGVLAHDLDVGSASAYTKRVMLSFGANWKDFQVTKGRIDDIRVYARALSLAEIQAQSSDRAPRPVANITVSPASVAVTIGGTQQLVATAKDSIGNLIIGRPIAWSSSDTSVVRVSADGLVTAVAVGTASISASAEGKTGVAQVAVSSPNVVAAFAGLRFEALTMSGDTTVYALATLLSTTAVGSTTLTPGGLGNVADMVVMRLDTALVPQWAVHLVDGGAREIAVDALGRVLVTSLIDGISGASLIIRHTAGTQSVTSGGKLDGAVVTLGAAGELVHLTRVTAQSNEDFLSVAAGVGGSVASGVFNGCCPTGSTTLVPPVGSPVGLSPLGFATGFIARSGSDGALLWNARIGDRDANFFGTRLAPAQNRVYGLAAVRFSSGDATLVDGVGAGFNIAKPCGAEHCDYLIGLDPNSGAYRWHLGVNAPSDASRLDVVDGKPALIARFRSGASFLSASGASVGSVAAGPGVDHRYVLRFSVDGALESSGAISSGDSLGVGISTARADGLLLVPVSFAGVLSASGTTLTASGARDGAVIGVEATGAMRTLVHLRQPSGGIGEIRAAAARSSGRVFAAGVATAGAEIGGQSIQTTGGFIFGGNP